MKRTTFRVLILLTFWNLNAYAQSVSTIAGVTAGGYLDGPVSSARFGQPSDLGIDLNGNIYIADRQNDVIRIINRFGEVQTFAGSIHGYADGTGSAAKFFTPFGVHVDINGNILLADMDNRRIRNISHYAVVTTIAGDGSYGSADGPAASASFFGPSDVCVDGSGNIYVAEFARHKIRKITPAGIVSTYGGSVAGNVDGPLSTALFNSPKFLCSDAADNIYVSDQGNHKIRKISPSGIVSTVAGGGATGSSAGFADGPGNTALFYNPSGICIDAIGNLYVADMENDRIRKISPAGNVTTLAGSTRGYADGSAASAKFSMPTGVCVDAANNVYVADTYNNIIRKITQPLTAISEISKNPKFRLYPNPSKGKVNLEAKNIINTVELYDNIGRLQSKFQPCKEQFEFKTEQLPKGVYFIRIYLEGELATEKLIVD